MTARMITPFENKERLQAAATDFVAATLTEALEARSSATLLCAGGSTPGPVYEMLSKTNLNWSCITVGLTDERWVPEDHAASNAALIKRTLLQNLGKTAAFLPMVTDARLNAFDEANAVNENYASAFEAPDIAILGMGPDAHTLSWFPNAVGLNKALDPDVNQTVVGIEAIRSDVTGVHTTRLTLSLAAIAKTKRLLLLITGSDKRQVFETATPDMPISHLIAASGSRLTTYWAPKWIFLPTSDA